MPDERIYKFIKKHHVLTLATVQANEPYPAHCFYAFDAENKRVICSSDFDTRHAKEAIENNLVAGGIVLETKTVGKIQGLQFQGIMTPLTGEDLKIGKKIYLKKFPYALLMETTLWEIKFTFLKLTDNNLGFGKKLIWEK
ncbi:MAG: pyridoxamine 5'-phosphate oxidase family protein [Bacteroidales bacterium]|nr:pyridoxamine 5'-phosphate oxidase family protein [Bacteroidales bacterium]